MRDTAPPSPAVVVGIDGSRRAINAALWAVDEAVERDLPLRLVYAIEPRADGRVDHQSIAQDFATAESAVRTAAMAVESIDLPVKIEVEIGQGHPVEVLVTASRSASMVCVGTLGVNHATGKRLGSAVIGLLSRSKCPVAIITGDTRPHDDRWIVTEFHDSPDGPTILGHAIEEARIRRAPLRVLTTWQPMFPDLYDKHAAASGERQARGRLERSMARYRMLHPDLDLKAVAVQGNSTNYLARHAYSIQLVVVGHGAGHQLADITRPGVAAALANLNCSLLVSERHGAL